MTYAADHRDVACYAGEAPATRDVAASYGGLLRRIFEAVFESRQRHADLDIARFIARSGGHLTDDIERRMMERLTTPSFGTHG